MYLALVMTARAFSMARRASYTKLALGSEQVDCCKDKIDRTVLKNYNKKRMIP